jgi:hypothetical protein
MAKINNFLVDKNKIKKNGFFILMTRKCCKKKSSRMPSNLSHGGKEWVGKCQKDCG